MASENDKNSNTDGPQLSSRTREELIARVTASSRTVTIVMGPTGCGKSTLVPSALQRALGGTVLCTQPRRLAVVAVANRVAQQQQHSTNKIHVGYHVGQHNTCTSHTQLVFATAGILLEELRAHGIEILTKKYECILLDECHERSTESDLCLAAIRLLLLAHPNATARIVLMSATFDHQRYQPYFRSVVERLDVVTLETAESFASFYDRVTVHYLEGALRKGRHGYHENLRTIMQKDPVMDLAGSDGGRSLSPGLVRLIGDLVAKCHPEEPLEAPFLVFAPTYRHLEQIHNYLVWEQRYPLYGSDDDDDSDGELIASTGGKNMNVDVSVLHSSVDIEECLRSMQNDTKQNYLRRRILLASAIAESSVTIPGVTVVIDTCRSLEVKYDSHRKTTSSTTIFSSHSICDQRKGRTGRTCAGTVYRLLPQGYYWSKLKAYETPQLTLSDCRDESMALLASAAKEMADCRKLLLEGCLDPPSEVVAKGALSYLLQIGACFATPGQRTRYIATVYGTMMAHMPFSIADSRSIVMAAQAGYIHEMLLYRSIKTIRPSPIVNYFADEAKSRDALERYNPMVDPKEPITVAMAHMSAFMYWYTYWYGARRQAALRSFAEHTALNAADFAEDTNPKNHDTQLVNELVAAYKQGSVLTHNSRKDAGVWLWTPEVEDIHWKWCLDHEINPTSVRAIAETMDVTHKIFFVAKFEPEWLRSCPTDPVWNRAADWEGLNNGDLNGDTALLRHMYGGIYDSKLRRVLEATNYKDLADGAERRPEPEACVHFLQGNCTFGDRCRKAHSLTAPRPVCKYFLSGTCSKGKDCVFSHGEQKSQRKVNGKEANEKKVDPMQSCVAISKAMTLPSGPKGWIKENAHSMLLLGENNFSFSIALGSLGIQPALMTDDKFVDTSSRRFLGLDASRIRGGIDATRLHTNNELTSNILNLNVRYFCWLFPFTGTEEDDRGNEDMIMATFLSLSLLTKLSGIPHAALALALQGDQVVRWSVVKSALGCGWSLSKWAIFSHKEFPRYQPSRSNGDPFPYDHGRFYVFERHS